MFERSSIEKTKTEWKDVQEINSWITELGSFRVTEIAVEGSLLKSKLAWKISTLSQAYIYRLHELAMACAEAWNNKRYIASLTLARSIIETGVLLCEFDSNVKEGLESRNLDFLDDDVMKKTFSTRIDELMGEGEIYKATNILTHLQKKEREIPGLMSVYAHLSECAHPNQFGHFQHYGDLDHADGTVRYSDGKFLDAKFHSIVCAYSFVGLGINAYKRLMENIEKVADLQHELNPVPNSSK